MRKRKDKMKGNQRKKFKKINKITKQKMLTSRRKRKFMKE